MRRIVLLGLACFSLGCSAYGRAARLDTVAGWREFLDQFPGDERAELARGRLAELEFEEAKRVHTVVAYKRFLQEFPNAEQAKAADALLEGLRYNLATERQTSAAWRVLVREHAKGVHIAEAERRMAELELKELSTLNDAEGLAKAARSSDPARAGDAVAALDDADFKNATTASALYTYLRVHADGTHREAAKVKLLSMELDGLLASGLVGAAKTLLTKNPLGEQLSDAKARIKRADAIADLSDSKDERVRQALPAYHLRTIDDVLKSLRSSDPIDRWEAVEELGHHVSVRSIDPLLVAFRGERSPLVRQRAFDGLVRLLRALPRSVAEYEIATRVEALKAKATDGALGLSLAVLLDLSGELEQASQAYQRAFDPADPDPVVLRRWSEIRRERGQYFSAAVAARQLAVWVLQQTEAVPPSGPHNALTTARALCALSEASAYARNVIADARERRTEFPEDIEVFWRKAKESERLVSARLKDAELALRTEQPAARLCGDEATHDRLVDAEKKRLEVIGDLKRRPAKKDQRLLFEVLLESDPSRVVRELVAAP